MKEHINPGKPSTADKAEGATEKVDKRQGPQTTELKDEKLPEPMKPDISKG
jgi:hypothetical protein